MKRPIRFGIVVLCFPLAAWAGNLNPPAGPVAPSMKDLDDVEPRIAINAINTPGDANSVYRIAQRGSYYLTEDLVGQVGKHGIEIGFSDIKIDLNGFNIRGVFGSLCGISIDGVWFALEVTNGNIFGFGGHGIDGGSAQRPRVSDISALVNGDGGIILGPSAQVERCYFDGNVGAGLAVGDASRVANCHSTNNGFGIVFGNGCQILDCHVVGGSFGLLGGDGAYIQGCSVSSGNAVGISTGNDATILKCSAIDCGITGIQVLDNSSITECHVVRSGGVGIDAGRRCSIRQSNAVNCVGNGIDVGGVASIFACASTTNDGHGIVVADAGFIQSCSAIGNTLDGFNLGFRCRIIGSFAHINRNNGISVDNSCKVQSCEVSSNSFAGILGAANCVIAFNSCSSNGTLFNFPGIHIPAGDDDSTIRGNDVSGNDIGIDVDGANNVVVANISGDNNSFNYDIANGNRVAHTVTIAVSPGFSGSVGGLVVPTTDPWSNISY